MNLSRTICLSGHLFANNLEALRKAQPLPSVFPPQLKQSWKHWPSAPADSNRTNSADGQFSGDRLHDRRKNHTVHICRPNQEPEILDQLETVSAAPELPGFVLRMAKIW